jgi:hypothetical protein
MRALRSMRKLRSTRLGLLVYGDEGLDCHYSRDRIAEASAMARRVLVLRPANRGAAVFTRRRGHRVYRVQAECKPARLGRSGPKNEVFLWLASRLQEIAALSSKKGQLAISPTEVRTEAFRLYVPHHDSATIRAAYGNAAGLEGVEARMREILSSGDFRWSMDVASDRLPFTERPATAGLLANLGQIAERWDIALEGEASVWPSVAGLVPRDVAALCGLGAEAADTGTPRAAITPLSRVQRTRLLAQLLAEDA